MNVAYAGRDRDVMRSEPRRVGIAHLVCQTRP